MNDGTKRRAVKTLLTFSWRVEEFRRDGDKIVTKLLKYGTFVSDVLRHYLAEGGGGIEAWYDAHEVSVWRNGFEEVVDDDEAEMRMDRVDVAFKSVDGRCKISSVGAAVEELVDRSRKRH